MEKYPRIDWNEYILDMFYWRIEPNVWNLDISSAWFCPSQGHLSRVIIKVWAYFHITELGVQFGNHCLFQTHKVKNVPPSLKSGRVRKIDTKKKKTCAIWL